LPLKLLNAYLPQPLDIFYTLNAPCLATNNCKKIRPAAEFRISASGKNKLEENIIKWFNYCRIV
jgi:hypothetical protein